MKKILGLWAITLLIVYQTEGSPLTIIYQWKQLEFYESKETRAAAIQSGIFVPTAAVPIDVGVYYANQSTSPKIFMTIPRFAKGIPLTLGVVSEKKYNGEIIIEPYPSLIWHQNLEACATNRIVSVFRVKVDVCGRLWVIDSGKIGDNQTCPPQILAFDLNTNELVNRFVFPPSFYESRSLLVNIIPDVRDPSTCQDTFIYVADCRTYSVIVYDVKNNNAWKVTDKTFYPYPTYGYVQIQDQHFDVMDGVMGMDLSPFDPNNPTADRILFYHALSSVNENWVYTSTLRNQSRFENNPNSSPELFHTYCHTRPSQSSALAIDKNGVEYFGLARETSINCWNTNTDYRPDNINTIYYNPVTMQFASGVKVITDNEEVENLWILTMRVQKLSTSTYNANETNFRISTGRISTILENTDCLKRT